MIHTVKGFDIVNKAEIDVFLELSWLFDDPADVGNLRFSLSQEHKDIQKETQPLSLFCLPQCLTYPKATFLMVATWLSTNPRATHRSMLGLMLVLHPNTISRL